MTPRDAIWVGFKFTCLLADVMGVEGVSRTVSVAFRFDLLIALLARFRLVTLSNTPCSTTALMISLALYGIKDQI